MRALADVAGRRVATSYPVLVGGYLRDRGIEAEVIRLDGAVESAVQLGVAEVVADVVSTGTTLRGAGLTVFGEPILESEAVLIRPRAQDLFRRRRSTGCSHNFSIIIRRISRTARGPSPARKPPS